MMRELAVCLPLEVEGAVVAELERRGHRVVLRAASADELEEAVAAGEFEAGVVGAGPAHLTDRLLASCDAAGIRLVALAATAADRRHALELGLLEVLEATADPSRLEAMLEGGAWDAGGGAAADLGAEAVPDGGAVAAWDAEHGGSRGGVADRSLSGRPERERPERERPSFDRPSRRRSVSARETAAPDVPPRRGEVIAVWGPAGAPGRTTIAIALAAELAAEGFSVVLADADTHSGAVAPSLGLLDEAPGFAAACRLAGANALTTAELERVGERYLSPHGSFWVLTGIGRPHRWPELSGERVVATIAACREWVDYTIIDTGFSLENDEELSSDLFGPRRNAATISALREADRVVAVGSGDPVGLSRFLRAHVDLLEVVDAERVTTVMNRIRGSVIGLNPAAQVEQTLRRFGGIVSPGLVPHDQAALDAAILAGKTLRDVAGRSPARLALSRFVAERILPPVSGVPSGKGAPAGRGARSRFAPVT